MKIFQFLISISLLSYSLNQNQILTKYGHLETYDGLAVFDSNDFGEGDKMYFKLEIYELDYLYNDIEYYYLDSSTFNRISGYRWASYSSSSSYYKDGYRILRKYFNIKKKKSDYGSSTSGRYLAIVFPVYLNDWAYIENTKETKLPTWAIVVIVIVIVLIIAGLIIYFCYRRRKRMQAVTQTNAATVATAAAAANYATQQNLQAQVYHAQANQALAQAQVYQAQAEAQAYQAQAQAQAQAYQAQMNSAQTYPPQNYQGSQPYPPQNYQAPPNSNDFGYSSKAVM